MLHSSNLRPVKRIDLLLEAAARVRPRESFQLVILAGEASRRSPTRSGGSASRTG